MRIKQIELNGFKSFMERTILELPPGVTAIVGPNGCGKSNIVDAIRWVLGEQSPRHLRGEAMEDVIFTGNTENGPLGMAEVALLLERGGVGLASGGEHVGECGAVCAGHTAGRARDILRELDRQMASLERHARRAEEYHRIKQDLRELDLRVMAVRQRSWSAEVATLGDRLAALQAAEAAAAEAIRQRRGALDEAHAARATNEERLRAVEEELTAERLAAAEAQARSGGLAERGRELAARAAESRGEAERIAVRLAELARETAALRAEVERLGAELPEAEAACAQAEGHLEALAHAGAPLERAVEEGKDALLDDLAEEARLRNLAEALRQRRDDLDGRRRRLEDEQRALGERLHANARASEGARAAIGRLQGERVRLGAERQSLGELQRRLGVEETAQLAVLEQARAEAT